MSVTFKVHDVKPPAERLEASAAEVVWKDRLNSTPEAWSEPKGLVRDKYHPLVGAVQKAWSFHLPLALSPDALWLTITQGLATHVNEHAEALRHQFVQHEGKKQLIVERGLDFSKGRRDNDWPGVFGEFSAQIKEYLGKRHDLIVSSFSTTGPVERSASEIVLMDAMQAYFQYTVRTLCGFPAITLEGTKTDWMDLIARSRALGEFDLGWWVPSLVDVLETMVTAFDGKVLKTFWGSMYASGGGSGGPFVGGWINAFFPYLGKGRYLHKNRIFATARTRGWNQHGATLDDFPSGMAVAPFVWEDLARGKKYEMDFVGGLLGVAQDEDTTLRPVAGWGIRDRKDEPRGPTGVKEREAKEAKARADQEAYWKKAIAEDPSLAARLNRGERVELVGTAIVNTRSVAKSLRDRIDDVRTTVRAAPPPFDEQSLVGTPADPVLESVRDMDPGVLEARLKASKAAAQAGDTELQADLAAYNAADAKKWTQVHVKLDPGMVADWGALPQERPPEQAPEGSPPGGIEDQAV